MIAFLTGRVAGKAPPFAFIDVGGVGYKLAMPTGSLAALPVNGGEGTVRTHLVVREDGLSLFGFATEEEQSLFEQLIGVSGVGPKVALALLSALPSEQLAAAIAREDVALISSAPGVGKKTAQRLIVELKDRLGSEGAAGGGKALDLGATAEARDALLSMGFAPAEAAAALADAEGDSAQTVLKHALRRLGGAA